MGDCSGLMFPKPVKEKKGKKAPAPKKGAREDLGYCPECYRSVHPDADGACPHCGSPVELGKG